MVIINRRQQERRASMRKSFESDIQHLKDELLLLGSMVEHSTLEAV